MVVSRYLFSCGVSAFVALTTLCGCTGSSKTTPAPQNQPLTNLNEETARNEQQAQETARALAEMKKQQRDEIDALKSQISDLNVRLKAETDADTIADLRSQMDGLRNQLASSEQRAAKDIAVLQNKLLSLRGTVDSLEGKILDKISSGSLAQNNLAVMQDAMAGHTTLYSLKGTYNTLVIPVEFAPDEGFDGNFKDPSRFTSGVVQEELFGNNPHSLHTYYQHVSGGLLNVTGTVVEPVRVDRGLTYYGKAIAGEHDEHARELVVDALKKLKARIGENSSFWKQFDRWDLNDLDRDGVYNEPDGFLDAVILIYAGKEQAACQSIFDAQNKQPGSDDVSKDDPRRTQALECYNRIWPHRSSIFLPKDSPDFPTHGPKVEGQDRGALGYRINDELYAFDYNMQSEYSDVSTFIHEFGHSLTLPDVYALQGDNNVGSWDIMAENARNFAQEESAYHRMALGWLKPKIINEGETTSAYLGSMNFISPTKRESYASFAGPEFITQFLRGFENKFSITSKVPQSEEPVYSALMVKMKPSVKKVQEVQFPAFVGTTAAYSGRFDNGTRSLRFVVDVPQSGDAMLAFDTIYHVETETNFNSHEKSVRVVTDYDTGSVRVNDEIKDVFRLSSGDEDNDSLVEKNPNCEAPRVLELRGKIIDAVASAAEKQEFKTKLAACQQPVWVTKSYDLSAFRGQRVKMEIAYTTDPGYNEFGIFIDNIRLGNQVLFDFEDGVIPGGEWVASVNGNREVRSNQFYMLEYRDPSETYNSATASYNMDLNIQGSRGMAMLLGKDAGATERERFRLVTLQHQPGVLGWYFDSTYDRRSNTPEVETQKGHGYYLPINNELRELSVPGVFANADFKDANGFYDTALPAYKDTVATQGTEFKCFAYPEFAKYLDGKAPDCSSFDDVNGLNKLHMDGRKLHFSRDSGNNFLPAEQRQHFQVSAPGWLIARGTFTRSSVQTFRSPEAGNFAPMKVWKANASGEMELDPALTAQASVAEPMDHFDDSSSTDAAPHLQDKRFLANRATVQARGFHFRVVSPDAGVAAQYTSPDPDSNASVFRQPKAKILINWDAPVEPSR